LQSSSHASCIVGIIGVCYHSQPRVSITNK
jgi:hypothetical protein